ncbi:carbohydrate kinase family protein [Belliella marina]|uniref:Carbohydrate kinase family protein n=1 Tax=Belliella marina TaxID=1644146 RepID=A0ABW4VNG1_9BACT
MEKKKLLVVGELNVDLILNDIQGFPKIGEEIVANKMNLTLGSSSAIFASNISTLGVDTAFCGMVGEDYFGGFIESKLQEKGVDCTYLRRLKEKQSGVTVVMNYDQDRANVTYCGAMEELGIQDIPWDHIGQFGHLHFSNLFLQNKIRKDIVALFEKAKSKGLTTSLDLQTDPDGVFDFDYRACLPFVDIFLPNKSELLGITKADTIDDAMEIIKPFANSVVVKMGEQGSILYNGQGKTVAQGYLHDSFVDAIGAGDSFNAGFISKFLSGEKLEACLNFGNLIGAINTTAAGGTGAFDSREHYIKIAKEIFNQEI